MKRLFALAVAGFILAACSTQPVYNVESRPVPVQAQKLSMAQIEKAIVEAGTKRAWIMTSAGPGKLTASQKMQKYGADVEITYDQKSFSIRKLSTYGMRTDGENIHQHYNFWIRNLESDIQAALAAASF